MRKIAIGLSMAALVLGGGAYAAQEPAPSQDQRGGERSGKMRGGDADGNGVLTRAEVQAQTAQRFARMDVNKDGKVDAADRQARREARRGEMFAQLDADKNGQISRSEFMAEREPRAGERGKRGMRGRHHGARHGAMGGGRMLGAAKAPMTQAQYTTAALTRFDATDANKDGQVTREERQAARAKMRQKWQERRAQKAQS